MAIPKTKELYNPIFIAIKKNGGKATNEDIQKYVISKFKLSANDLNEIHRGSRTKISYIMAWARNHLKKMGYIIDENRGLWKTTKKGEKYNQIQEADIKSLIREFNSSKK